MSILARIVELEAERDLAIRRQIEAWHRAQELSLELDRAFRRLDALGDLVAAVRALRQAVDPQTQGAKSLERLARAARERGSSGTGVLEAFALDLPRPLFEVADAIDGVVAALAQVEAGGES